jgi:hypothetical protein
MRIDERPLPSSGDELAKHLNDLHLKRRKLQQERKEEEQQPRRPLNDEERKIVLKKTTSHCHLCGGDMNENAEGELIEERETMLDPVKSGSKRNKPVFDHIVPHAAGGSDDVDNFLAAHGLCNGARWFYSPEEFQWILRMGVWARKQMESGKTKMSEDMREAFLKNEEDVRSRRTVRNQD